jgi:amidase
MFQNLITLRFQFCVGCGKPVLAFIEEAAIMIDKTMTRRQFNKLLMAGAIVSAEGLLNSSLATTSFAKTGDMTCFESYSATSLVKAIKNKKTSATELLKYFMDRHKRLDKKINAVVTTDFEGALKRAQKADEALSRGETWGPLHGLPMTIKDNIEVVGMPTTYGSPMFRGYIPQKNADVVQSLLDAGAIIFGKTNLPLFGMDTQSFNDVYGQTNNPWDVSKTPGGSSGGAAAALAAGLTGLEIGNDIGGSIRLPAHFCGIYGHKPSYKIVSNHGGEKPWKTNHSNYPVDLDLAVSGPLARSAEDLKLAMDVIVAPPSYQRKAIKIKLPDSRKLKLKEFRVGLWIDDSLYPPDNDVGNCLQIMVEKLTKAGVNLKDIKPDIDLKQSHWLRGDLETSTLSHLQPPGYYEWAVSQVKTLKDDDQSGTARWVRAMTGYHRDWNKLNEERAIMRQKWEDYFQDIDVLLCPVARIAAHNHDHTKIGSRTIQFDNETLNYWDVVGPWNSLSLVSYLPSTVAPIGFTPSGLPVGVQIIGPYLEDYTSIQFAKLLERMNGSYKPPKGFEF